MPENNLRIDRKLSDQLTRFTIEKSQCGIFWIDQAGKIIFVNDTACETLGYAHAELLAMYVHQLDPNFSEEDWTAHWNTIKRERNLIFESKHLSKTDEAIPVELTINFIEISGQEFHCVYTRNLSEQKKVERVLKENEERFRLTLDATSDGMWDKNLKTGEIHYGKNWASSLGYKKEDIKSGKITWQSLLHPEDKEKTLQAVQDHLDGKTTSYTCEFRLLNANKQWQWMLGKGKIVQYDEQGNPERFVGIQSDISERKVIEEQLKKHADKTRLFAYSIAHDLKNPTIAIRGLTERLSKQYSILAEEKLHEYYQLILQASKQIDSLVQTINDFVSSKTSPLQIEKVDLSELLETIHAEFADQLQSRNITWEQSQNLPTTIQADKLSILRVLKNFVDNSIKYGGDSLSKITIAYQEQPQSHVIIVQDNGVGLTEDDAIDLFSPFERKSTSKGICGTGLGLAIVKEIIRQHKGSVWTEKPDEGGVKFCISIAKNLSDMLDFKS